MTGKFYFLILLHIYLLKKSEKKVQLPVNNCREVIKAVINAKNRNLPDNYFIRQSLQAAIKLAAGRGFLSYKSNDSDNIIVHYFASQRRVFRGRITFIAHLISSSSRSRSSMQRDKGEMKVKDGYNYQFNEPAAS